MRTTARRRLGASTGVFDASTAATPGCPDGQHWVDPTIKGLRLGDCVPNFVQTNAIPPASMVTAPAPAATLPAPAVATPATSCPALWPWWWLLVAAGAGIGAGAYVAKQKKGRR